MVNDVKVRLAIIESKALGVELHIAKLEMRGHIHSLLKLLTLSGAKV